MFVQRWDSASRTPAGKELQLAEVTRLLDDQ